MTELGFWQGVATGVGAAGGALVVVWWLLRRRWEVPSRHAEGPSTGSDSTWPPAPVGPDPGGRGGVPPRSASRPAATPYQTSAPPTGQFDDPTTRLQLSKRILLHLARQGRLGPDDVAPREMSQAGMVESLHVGQGTLTGALRALVDAGLLSEKREHARGVERRVKIYRLTSAGEALAKEIRSHRTTAPVAIRKPIPVSHDPGVAPAALRR